MNARNSLEWGKKITALPLKARLHMRFLMRFRRDFDAILRTKPATAYPARVCGRVTLRQNTAKLERRVSWNDMW